MTALQTKSVNLAKADERLQIVVRGAVQGVGFRPFIYRLATGLKLRGWVNNSNLGVFIEVEGQRNLLQEFLLRVETEKPPRAYIQSLESRYLDPARFSGFEIRKSDTSGTRTALILPDIATCPDCLAEILDPANRRFGYPFTNCTNCGPRFSIINSLPYDRPRTSMAGFTMCEACQQEYDDPLDRRFHAQPNACPDCGPELSFLDSEGSLLSTKSEALEQCAREIDSGAIVAVKGLGGFHLLVDSENEKAILEMRHRKRREEKPFALMYPTLELVARDCDVSPLEERLLRSPEAPIVLLAQRQSSRLMDIAPGNPNLGVMLPYTPLHHLLLRRLGKAVVATSGNVTDEPICIDEEEALKRLKGIADFYLVHNRPIVRHVDDSIVRVIGEREMVVRRARGFAPLPVRVNQEGPSLVAVGAHLKNTVALSVGREVFLSQHIGDLETIEAYSAFSAVIGDLSRLYEIEPERIICDEHPDYRSTRYAKGTGKTVSEVQHHAAHVYSCMADNCIEGEVLGVAWDGTGLGDDGTIWGGEFLKVDESGYRREAHLRTFRLPGGERAVRSPGRIALGLLYEIYGEAMFEVRGLKLIREMPLAERKLLLQMLSRGINAPLTSSAGRLFDGVAALCLGRLETRFEGQAAMELEFAIGNLRTGAQYDLAFKYRGQDLPTIVDWEPMIIGIIEDLRTGAPRALVSAKFHNTLVEAIVAIAGRTGETRVVLSGGCFQNKYLAERAIKRLREEGCMPYWHQRVPPNDGGIALGQIAGLRMLGTGDSH